jgi:hypothetical protein
LAARKRRQSDDATRQPGEVSPKPGNSLKSCLGTNSGNLRICPRRRFDDPRPDEAEEAAVLTVSKGCLKGSIANVVRPHTVNSVTSPLVPSTFHPQPGQTS